MKTPLKLSTGIFLQTANNCVSFSLPMLGYRSYRVAVCFLSKLGDIENGPYEALVHLMVLSYILCLIIQQRTPTSAGPLPGAGPNLIKSVKSAENRPCLHLNTLTGFVFFSSLIVAEVRRVIFALNLNRFN